MRIDRKDRESHCLDSSGEKLVPNCDSTEFVDYATNTPLSIVNTILFPTRSLTEGSWYSVCLNIDKIDSMHNNACGQVQEIAVPHAVK
jgi:hypothetical protein